MTHISEGEWICLVAVVMAHMIGWAIDTLVRKDRELARLEREEGEGG
jgi:hypothetical protein